MRSFIWTTLIFNRFSWWTSAPIECTPIIKKRVVGKVYGWPKAVQKDKAFKSWRVLLAPQKLLFPHNFSPHPCITFECLLVLLSAPIDYPNYPSHLDLQPTHVLHLNITVPSPWFICHTFILTSKQVKGSNYRKSEFVVVIFNEQGNVTDIFESRVSSPPFSWWYFCK